MKNVTRAAVGWWLVVLLSGWPAPAAPAGSEDAAVGDPAEPGPEVVHVDGAAFEAALLDAVRAFIRGDATGAETAMALMEEKCHRLTSDAAIPEEIQSYDFAFHAALTRAREFASRGDYDRSFEQFVWIQKGCRGCHALAVEHGVAAPVIRTAAGGTDR